MAGLHQNRSGEMEVFVRVVELGGFSPAARAVMVRPSDRVTALGVTAATSAPVRMF